MTNKITKAVIPVAGLGTRMLPATKAIPKEMLPVVDKPMIQYIVDECVAAGIKEIVWDAASLPEFGKEKKPATTSSTEIFPAKDSLSSLGSPNDVNKTEITAEKFGDADIV